MRFQLIELHEQSWFPSTIRDEITDAMQFALNWIDVYAPAAPIIRNVLDFTGSRCILDLCSGGGGPWLDLASEFQLEDRTTGILLTDKYPNLPAPKASKDFNKAPANIDFYPHPVDAMDIPDDLNGLRTMFSSFHHFPPDNARAILQNAVDAGAGICIFEVTRRNALTILLMLPWALVPFLVTPWIRPFRWSRLLWTYIVPIIPLVLLFDGIVSCLRTYRPHELRRIVDKLRGARYRWEIGEHSGRDNCVTISCLAGYPESNAD